MSEQTEGFRVDLRVRVDTLEEVNQILEAVSPISRTYAAEIDRIETDDDEKFVKLTRVDHAGHRCPNHVTCAVQRGPDLMTERLEPRP